jgi:RNA polymerase sigma-70 factor (ECF subfamily)
VPFASLTSDDVGPSVDPSRFRGRQDPYPGGWREFPHEWPEQVVLSNEVRHVVLGALDSLPPRQRAVVSLRDLAGHSSEEVSTMLHVTSGNQRVLLHRGRSVVRAHLERYFAGDTVGEVVWVP